ncbi:kinase-like domain-containing protein [Poronia punctata]|nr:kinase-like domain-containing protein [Poronia punctata]
MVLNKELNDCREPGCWAILADKKYYQVGTSCIKRTLRPHEWQSTIDGTLIIPPATYPQRWKNDAAILGYLHEKTDIPLPRLQSVFEDDGAFYHSTEYVEGVLMSELTEEKKQVVIEELLQHVATLRSLRSDVPGVPGDESSLLCPPQRVTSRQWKVNSCWRPREEKGEYVFCHNDLGQHNIIVDPETLKINAIIDWEFAGFWPEWFERCFWERQGPRVALEGEDDDVGRCRDWLMNHCDEVIMPHLRGVSEKVARLGLE